MSKIPLTLRFPDPKMGTQRDLRVKRKGLPPSWQAYTHSVIQAPEPFLTLLSESQALWDSRLSQDTLLLISDFSLLRCLTPSPRPGPGLQLC